MLASVHFWMVFIGAIMVFITQHVLGLFAMPRRVWDYLPDPSIVAMNQIATIGAFIMGIGMAVFLYNMLKSSASGKPAKMEDPFEIGEQYYDYRRREPH